MKKKPTTTDLRGFVETKIEEERKDDGKRNRNKRKRLAGERERERTKSLEQ